MGRPGHGSSSRPDRRETSAGTAVPSAEDVPGNADKTRTNRSVAAARHRIAAGSTWTAGYRTVTTSSGLTCDGVAQPDLDSTTGAATVCRQRGNGTRHAMIGCTLIGIVRVIFDHSRPGGPHNA